MLVEVVYNHIRLLRLMSLWVYSNKYFMLWNNITQQPWLQLSNATQVLWGFPWYVLSVLNTSCNIDIAVRYCILEYKTQWYKQFHSVFWKINGSISTWYCGYYIGFKIVFTISFVFFFCFVFYVMEKKWDVLFLNLKLWL